MRKKGYSFLYFILFCCTFTQIKGQEPDQTVLSQSTVRGVVLDEQGKALPFATITAFLSSAPNIPIKGTISSQEGMFEINIPANKNFLITAHFLGYRDTTCQIKTTRNIIDLDKLTLFPQSQLLEGVTVRPTFSITADKIIYNFENDKDRATSNLMNMIEKMPLILVDHFTGQIYIESQVKTYIVLRNGKIDALFSNSSVSFEDILKKLPAMGFTQFEIWQQPPLRYKNYDYVINIIADKTQRLSGVVGSSHAYHDFDKMYTSLNQGVNGSAADLRFSGGFTFINENNPKREQSIRSQYYATEFLPEISINQEKKFQRDHQRYAGNLKMSYDLSKKQFINLTFEYSQGNVNDKQYIHTDSCTQEVRSRFENQALDKTRHVNWLLGINYQYDFLPGSRILNLSYSINQRPVKNIQETTQIVEWENDEGNTLNRQKKVEDITHKFQIDYTDNFANSKFTLDLDLGYLIKKYNDQSHSYDPIAQLENSTLYTATKQDINRIDGYAELKWNPTDKLCLTGKIIADYLPKSNKTKTVYDKYSENIAQHGLLYYPVFTARYTFNTPTSKELDFIEAFSLRSSVELSYRQLRNRPSPQQMSNYTDRSNPQWIKRGNPDLKPELCHRLFVSISLGLPNDVRILPNFNYSSSKNKIMPYSFAEITKTQNKIVASYTNAKTKTLGVGLHINYGIKLLISGNFNKAKIDILGDKSTNSSISLNGRYNFDALKFIRIGSIFTYHKYCDKGARGMKIPHPFSLGFNLTPKSIKIGQNELRTTITFNNVLNWNNSKTSEFIQNSTLNMESTSFRRNLPISLTLRYSFGKFKTKPLKSTRRKAEINGFSKE